jgi:hypothetical protein
MGSRHVSDAVVNANQTNVIGAGTFQSNGNIQAEAENQATIDQEDPHDTTVILGQHNNQPSGTLTIRSNRGNASLELENSAYVNQYAGRDAKILRTSQTNTLNGTTRVQAPNGQASLSLENNWKSDQKAGRDADLNLSQLNFESSSTQVSGGRGSSNVLDNDLSAKQRFGRNANVTFTQNNNAPSPTREENDVFIEQRHK